MATSNAEAMSTPSNAPTFPPDYAKADRSGQLVAANVTMLITSTVFLGLRLYVRRLTNSPRGWDEFLLPPAYLLLLGVIVSTWREQFLCPPNMCSQKT